jgi:acetyl-CoA carboxylase carboxyl transferase subunit beta
MTSKDPLHLWIQKICRSIERCYGKTNLKMQCTGVGKSKGKEVVICCMDFAFIGGSMGAVGRKKQEELITLSKQNAFHNDF